MTIIKLASKKKQIERYLYRHYRPFVSAQYHHAVSNKDSAINAAQLIKRTLGKNGIEKLKEFSRRIK